MAEADVFPDAEAIVCDTLAQIPGAGHVGTRIPEAPTGTVVRVTRLGGIPAVRGRLDLARIQVEVFDDQQATAHDVAVACIATLLELAGTTQEDAFVTAVEQDLGLASIPDPATAQPRYIFGVALYLHRSSA